MYGVPADLDLSIFERATLIQLAIGEFQVQFRFDSDGIISAEGKWELRNANGEVVDEAESTASPNANAERDAYRLHVILGKTVERYAIDPPHSFSLRFTTGHLLTVFDDSKQYESFQIQPGNIVV
jgi:hypothetical protein